MNLYFFVSLLARKGNTEWGHKVHFFTILGPISLTVGTINSTENFFLQKCIQAILKMASGETIRRSYECLPVFGIFFCVKNLADG